MKKSHGLDAIRCRATRKRRSVMSNTRRSVNSRGWLRKFGTSKMYSSPSSASSTSDHNSGGYVILSGLSCTTVAGVRKHGMRQPFSGRGG